MSEGEFLFLGILIRVFPAKASLMGFSQLQGGFTIMW